MSSEQKAPAEGRLFNFSSGPGVLPEPVLATHAQLRILSVHGGGFGQVILGEWKVIAPVAAATRRTQSRVRRARKSETGATGARGRASMADGGRGGKSAPLATLATRGRTRRRRHALTTDRHFRQMGFQLVPARPARARR